MTLQPVDEIDFAYSLNVDRYNKYGAADEAAALDVIRSGRLFYPIGTRVTEFSDRVAREFGAVGASLVTSGTAAVHTALAAVGVDFGDEVVTTPLADTGTVIPIMLQGAIPIFADVDPNTLMITAETIGACLSPRTRAILVVHLGGFPAELDPILTIAEQHDVPVVEDCAQAPLSWYQGRRIGSLGAASAFSVNDTKHVSCGDGGIVVSNSADVAHRARLCMDKGFDRDSRVRNPLMVAPNYRMTEIQAAILDAQWEHLRPRVDKRRAFAARLDAVLAPYDEYRAFQTEPGNESSYFSYFFSVSEDAPASRDHICRLLCQAGIPARRGNLYDVQYRLNTFHSARPRYLEHLTDIPDYSDGLCPEAESANARTVRLEMLETFGDEEADAFAKAITSLYD